MRRLALLLAALPMTGVTAPGDTDQAAEFNLTEPGLYAVFQTSMGTFIAELFEDQAPETVANFVGLATGEKPWRAVDKQALSEEGITALGLDQRRFASQQEVEAARAELDRHIAERIQALPVHEREPFYDGVLFHRVVPGFVIQAGAPRGVEHPRAGGPGFAIEDEFVEGLHFDVAGRLAMANSGPDTGGSQFFVTVRPTPELDFTQPQHRARGAGWAIFGQVIRGMEVVEAINQVPVQGETPVEDVTLQHVAIVRVGDETAPATASPASPE